MIRILLLIALLPSYCIAGQDEKEKELILKGSSSHALIPFNRFPKEERSTFYSRYMKKGSDFELQHRTLSTCLYQTLRDKHLQEKKLKQELENLKKAENKPSAETTMEAASYVIKKIKKYEGLISRYGDIIKQYEGKDSEEVKAKLKEDIRIAEEEIENRKKKLKEKQEKENADISSGLYVIRLQEEKLAKDKQEYQVLNNSIEHYQKQIEYWSGFKPQIQNNHNQSPPAKGEMEEQLKIIKNEIKEIISLKQFTVYDLTSHDTGWLDLPTYESVLNSLIGDNYLKIIRHKRLHKLFLINLEFPDPMLDTSFLPNLQHGYKQQVNELIKLLKMRLEEDVVRFIGISNFITANNLKSDTWSQQENMIPAYILTEAFLKSNTQLIPNINIKNDRDKFRAILERYHYVPVNNSINPQSLDFENLCNILFQTVEGGLLGRLIKALDEKDAFSWHNSSELDLLVQVRNLVAADPNADVSDFFLKIAHRILKRHLNLSVLERYQANSNYQTFRK